MIEFNLIWQLLAPLPRCYSRQRKCFETWQSLSEKEQKAIFERIQSRKEKDNDLCEIVTITGPFPNSNT